MLASTYLPLAVTNLYHGGSPGTAVGLVLGAAGLTTAILTPLTGWLGDRFGHWRLLAVVSLLAAVLWPLPALTNELIGFTIIWAITSGVMSSVFSLLFNVLASSVSNDIRARVMSLSFLPLMIGSAIGPALGVVITPHGLTTIFPVAGVTTILGFLALLVSRRQPAQRDVSAAA
jgi:MFS family permease